MIGNLPQRNIPQLIGIIALLMMLAVVSQPHIHPNTTTDDGTNCEFCLSGGGHAPALQGSSLPTLATPPTVKPIAPRAASVYRQHLSLSLIRGPPATA